MSCDEVADSGQFVGFLDAGELFKVGFTQGLSGRISIPQAILIPPAIWLLVSALGWTRRRSA